MLHSPTFPFVQVHETIALPGTAGTCSGRAQAVVPVGHTSNRCSPILPSVADAERPDFLHAGTRHAAAAEFAAKIVRLCWVPP